MDRSLIAWAPPISTSGLGVFLLASAVIGAILLVRHRWSPEGKGASEPIEPSSKTTAPRWSSLGLAALITGLFVGALTAAVPIRVSGVTPGEISVVTGAPLTVPDMSSPPAELTVRVRAEGAAQVVIPPSVSIALDQLLAGVTLDGWSRSIDDPTALVTDSAGNELSIRGRFPTLDLLFVTGPGAGSVHIEVGDIQEAVDLDAEAPGVNLVRISSGLKRTSASAAFMWSGQTLQFPEPVARLEPAAVGLLPVRVDPVIDDAGQIVGARVDRLDAIRAYGVASTNVLLLTAVAFLLLLAGFIIGTGCAPAGAGRGPLGRIRLATYGLALSSLIVGAANNLVPVRWAILLLIPLIAVGTVRLALRPSSTTTESEPAPDLSGVVTSVVAVVAFNAFWFVMSGRWALGFLQTDVFDTFNVTEMFWRRSALDASIAFGDGFRLIDYSARAAVWGTMLERPSDAIVVSRLLLTGLIAALAAGMVARQGFRAWTQVVVGVLVSSSAAFVGLYAEGYMSREFFIAWMLLGLLAVGHQLLDADTRRWPWWRTGAICCVSLAVVPPFFLIGPALVAAVVAAAVGPKWRGGLRRWKPPAGGLILSALVLGLPNLFWLRSSTEAGQYITALNGLVRNLVVPFYDTARFPGAMVGLLPFHHQDGYPLGGSAIRIGPLRWDTDWLASPFIVATVLAILIALFMLSAWVFRRFSLAWPERSFAVLWLSVVVVYLAGIGALRALKWNEQTYFAIMWIWTLAPVALAALTFVLLEAARLDRRVRPLLLSGVVLLAFVNTASTAGESLLWIESPSGERAAQWHYDQAAPLERFDRELQRGTIDIDETNFAVVIDQPSTLTGTDDDRVLTNVLVNLLEADGKRCADCIRNPDFYWVTASSSADSDIPIVVIGSTDCRDRRSVYVDEYFAVCAAVEP